MLNTIEIKYPNQLKRLNLVCGPYFHPYFRNNNFLSTGQVGIAQNLPEGILYINNFLM